MNKALFQVMAMGLLIIGVSLALAADKPGYPGYVKKTLYADDYRGKAAPELVVDKWLTDKPDTKGKVVLIDFWATWCGPCRAAIPELNELQKKFKADLVVIGVSAEKEQVLNDFRSKTVMNYALGNDPQKTTSKHYMIKGIPNVVIISTDGIVRWQGFPASSEEKLTPEIVKQVIDADPGVAERRKEEAKQKKA